MSRGSIALDGMRVVDLSGCIAGSYCTKLLADAGADVALVESRDGHPLRWRGVARGTDSSADFAGALFQYLAGSKRSMWIDPDVPADLELVRGLVRGADVVVWSAQSWAGAQPQFTPAELLDLVPEAAVLAMSPFGTTGPWADRAATEFTVQAWSGGLGQRGSVHHPPVSAGGLTGEWISGVLGAFAVLASRRRTESTGVGELLDVSMLESLGISHAMYPVAFFTTAGFPWRSRRYTGLPSIHPTQDGYVGFMVVSGQQWLDFCALIGRPDLADDESLLQFDNRNERREELVAIIDAWSAAQTSETIVETAALFRVPAAVVNNGQTLTSHAHLTEGGFFEENVSGGFLQPAPSYILSSDSGWRRERPAPRLGEHDEVLRALAESAGQRQTPAKAEVTVDSSSGPLDGIRVADLTAYWAGPVVGSFLGMLGADVIHVESVQRPDGMRMNTTRPLTEDQWWECSPLFQGANTNKRDVTLDLNNPRGREIFLDLVRHCDVLLENFSPRVMSNWNLEYEDLRRVNPDLIMVRMPAFGLNGPWRDRGGYAQTIEQVSGLAWITGHPEERPETPNGMADLVGGAHAAFATLVALAERKRTRTGLQVESPMLAGTLAIAAEQLVEYSAYGNLLTRHGNGSDTAAPHGIYLCADQASSGERDRWVAIAVTTDDQWAVLVRLVGIEGWDASPLRTVEGRLDARVEIDAALARWCSARLADDIVGLLWNEGVPVAVVTMPHEQHTLEQLIDRRYFEPVSHPVSGPCLHSGFPVRFSRGPHVLNRCATPLLGQHNDQVLGDLLGLSASEIEQLTEARVIGTRPISVDSALKGFR